MKLNGIIGKGTGKLGSSVFAISGGEQVVREYNPVVSNPNTDAQVAQRAKLKLMSQIGAVLSPALGFKKQGLVSARNQFVSKNIGLCTYENKEATVNLIGLDLTGSVRTLPALSITAEGAAQLASAAGASVKSVVYVSVFQTDDNKLEIEKQVLVTEAGQTGTFPAQLGSLSTSHIVYAYGLSDTISGTNAVYDDYEVNPDTGEGSLGVVQRLLASGAVPTMTRVQTL